jgi:uncharacterized membrane protein YgdD (TMEM256/DUF423 family)
MRIIVLAAAIGGFTAVTMGAFAAHGLRDFLGVQEIDWVETAVRYQAYHSLALLGIGALMAVRPARLLSATASAFAIGIVLFCGSLYGLAFSGVHNFALITPFGGGFFLVGWALLAVYALRLRPSGLEKR